SSSRLRWMTDSSSLPCAVSSTCRVVRSKSRNPTRLSSSLIRTLSPDGVMKSASAARVKLRCCATRRNARSCRVLTSIIESLSKVVEYPELLVQRAGAYNVCYELKTMASAPRTATHYLGDHHG